MTTITVDIINEKALKLLQDLELMQLIRVHINGKKQAAANNPLTKYKGTMAKQSISDIDKQLNELRSGWE